MVTIHTGTAPPVTQSPVAMPGEDLVNNSVVTFVSIRSTCNIIIILLICT